MMRTDLLGELASAQRVGELPPSAGKALQEPKFRNFPMATFSTRQEVQEHLVGLKERSGPGRRLGSPKAIRR
jgi:hypothetical protein